MIDSRLMIGFTERASNALHQILEAEADPELFVRLHAEGGGCSGYTFDLVFDDLERKGDRVFDTDNGLRVHVDEQTALLLTGSLIDFQDGGLILISARPAGGCTSCAVAASPQPSQTASGDTPLPGAPPIP